MAAHAVGNEKDVADFLKIVVVRRFLNRESVLIMAATDANVRHSGMFEIVETWHEPLRGAIYFIVSSHNASTGMARCLVVPRGVYVSLPGIASLHSLPGRKGLRRFSNRLTAALLLLGQCAQSIARSLSDPPKRLPIPSDGGDMAKRRCGWLATAGLLALLSGCVERRFVIESTPPGAKVYVNNRPIGFTPVDMPFTYYGTYLITLELDGHQTRTIEEKVSTPWYQYPGIDFVSENVYPFKTSDIHRLHYDMVPLPRPNLDQLLYDASEVRERGKNLPPPSVPVQPRPGRDAPPPTEPRPPINRVAPAPLALEPTP